MGFVQSEGVKQGRGG